MKRKLSDTFNKEKLIFIGVTSLLAICVYHFMASRPVALEVGIPVSPLPIPAPLAPEKPDSRQSNVAFYLESGNYSGLAVNRERNDPFAPIYEIADLPRVPVIPKPGPVAIIPPTPIPAPPGPNEEEKKKAAEDKEIELKEFTAKVDFSAVISMNGVVYGLLKDKDGKTIQVKVGDYLDDFKYTVSKIDKQAIWVTDENDRTYVARDQTFAGDGSSGGDDAGDDKAAKKKDKAVRMPKADAKPDAKAENKTDSTAAALAEAAKQLANLQKSMNANKNNVIDNNNGGRRSRRNAN